MEAAAAQTPSGISASHTRAETVKSRACIFSVSQSTFLLVFRKMTAWVIVRVSYRSHRVSSFHSCKPQTDAMLGKSVKLKPKQNANKLLTTRRQTCYTGSWGKWRADIKKEVPPRLIVNTVPLFFFSDIPMLTHPQELSLKGSASAV